jgi:hypothetical protein
MINREMAIPAPNEEEQRSVTFEEGRSLILEAMSAEPGNCDKFENLQNIAEHNLLRCPGATLDSVLDTLSELQKIHHPHCPSFNKKSRD